MNGEKTERDLSPPILVQGFDISGTVVRIADYGKSGYLDCVDDGGPVFGTWSRKKTAGQTPLGGALGNQIRCSCDARCDFDISYLIFALSSERGPAKKLRDKLRR